MGRPAHQPDETSRRQAEALAGYGVPETGIADMLGIDAKTLRKHYPKELRIGHTRANSAVAQSLFRKATGEGPQSVTAAIFWAKTRMGWKETIVNEHGGIAGNPVAVTQELKVRFISPAPETVQTLDLPALRQPKLLSGA